MILICKMALLLKKGQSQSMLLLLPLEWMLMCVPLFDLVVSIVEEVGVILEINL